MNRAELIDVAQGNAPADTVIRGAQLLDVFSGRFITGDVAIAQGFIAGIIENYQGTQVVDAQGMYLVPGFIDAHVHIESSMLEPQLYAQCVLPHGTTAVIWDPHEIANVKGIAGIEWALQASENCPLDIFVMIPSCVPSTPPAMGLETSGAYLTAADIAHFKDHPRVIGLAEMMNYPGVLSQRPRCAGQARPLSPAQPRRALPRTAWQAAQRLCRRWYQDLPRIDHPCRSTGKDE